jgi:hypothetical protein
MPATWVYVAGGVLAGILIFTIAYTLISASVRFNEKQNDLREFSSLISDASFVCYGGKGNFVMKAYKFSENLKIIYSTNNISCSSDSDCNYPLERCENNFCLVQKPVDAIKSKAHYFGKSICLQFKDEMELRCEALACNISFQPIGVMPATQDIWVAVNKILGKGNYKSFTLKIIKDSFDSINITSLE